MSDFAKQRVKLLELDLEKCINKFGALPCTAGIDIHTGTSQAGATDNTIKLDAGASAVDGFYNGNAITLADGRRAIIIAYNGTTKIATIDRLWPINESTRSEELDQWSQVAVTVDADAIVAPNGTPTADKIEETAVSSAHQILRQIGTYAINDVAHIKMRFRPNEISTLQFDLSDAVFGSSANAHYDLVNLLTATGGVGESFIRQLSSEWVECEYRGTCTVAGTSSAWVNLNQTYQGPTSYLGIAGNSLYGWGLQASINRPSEYVATGATAIGLPDAVDFRIIEAGGECYNTFGSCQDTANFIPGVVAHKYCSIGAPVPVNEQIRPYIESIDSAPTEINLERGFSPRGQVSITLRDDPTEDVEGDPYIATRLVEAGGSHFSRLLRRLPHYVGRPVRFKTAYLTDGWDDSKFKTEHYIVERIDPPDSDALVRMIVKDATKLADREELPKPTSGRLISALAADGLIAAMEPGDGDSYPASGFIRIADEVIEYESNVSNNLSWTDTSFRSKFNTTAIEHKVDSGVQLCQVWQNERISQVLEDLLVAAGIPLANIDTAGFLSEDDLWLGSSFLVSAQLVKPSKIGNLIADLVSQIGSYMWWDRDAQLVRFKVIAPIPPNVSNVTVITDEANIVERSIKVERLDELRITRTAIYYDLISATANRRKASSYLVVEVSVDLDAEGPNEYNEIRSDTIYSQWFGSENTNAVRASVNRRLSRLRDAPQRYFLSIDSKDVDDSFGVNVRTGGFVDLTTKKIVGLDGNPEVKRALVTKYKESNGKINIRARATDLNRRFGFISPSGAGDYPLDPEYAHISDGVLNFLDGTGPYLIF